MAAPDAWKGALVEPHVDPLLEHGLRLVSGDLEARGWLVEDSPGEGPPRIWASRAGSRRVVYLSLSRYPEAPPERAPETLRSEEGEPWLARVQLSRNLTPILNPQYIRLSPLETFGVSPPTAWPPTLLGITF